jgi:hypothetical protein
MTCAAAIASGFLGAVMSRGGGRHAVLELGPVYAAVVVVYTVYPLLGFLFNGLRYGELSDNRLFAIQPDAHGVARLAWLYVAHLGGFALAYAASRGRSGAAGAGPGRMSRFAVVVVGGLWLLVQAYFVGLERLYDWRFETNLDRYVALANLPLLLAQVTGHLGAIRFTLEVALLVMLYAHAKRPLLVVVPWLAFVAATTLAQHQSRTELVLLTFTAVVCFHLQVRPLSAVLLSTFAAAGIAGFVYLGATRDTFGELDVDTVPRLFVANEFESIFGNAFDLDQRVQSGEVRALPAAFFLADVLAPVPQQLLAGPKVFPADWYMRSFFPAEAERGVGLCFGTISEAVVGGGLPDALARGAALGLVFGAIHRFVSKRRPGLWWFVFYVWLTVMAYNSFRMTTFHLLVRTVYDFLPVVLVVKAVSIVVGLARRESPARPAPPIAA